MKILIFLLLVIIQIKSHSQDIVAYSNIEWCRVHAAVVGKKDGSPVVDVTGYLSLPGTVFTLGVAVSDSAGNLDFLIKKPKGSTTLVFQTDNPNANIIIEPGRSLVKEFIFDSTSAANTQFIDTLPFYGVPDKRYLLDDYTRFSTIEEIIIEYISEVRLKKQRGKFYFEVLNTPFLTFFSTPPLVLLDGVPVFEIDKLMSIDPLRIMKIEVVARKYYFGPLAWNGIVSFTSYDGGLAGYSLPSGAVATEY